MAMDRSGLAIPAVTGTAGRAVDLRRRAVVRGGEAAAGGGARVRAAAA